MSRPRAPVDALAKRLAPVTAETLAERALLAAWLRVTGGNPRAVEAAVADAALDAGAVFAPALSVADLAPWVDATLASTARPGERSPAVQWCRTPSTVRRWVVAAVPGAMLVYHVGELARDRATLPILDATADYVAALDDLGAVRTYVARTSLASCSVYGVQRRAGLTQHPVVLGVVAPAEYRALQALADRDANVSAPRAVERRISCSPERAAEIVESLLAGGYLRRETVIDGKVRQRQKPGVVLTERGLAAIGRAE